MGGLEFVKDLLLQDQASFTYIIQTLRWDNETSHGILQTLQAVQLVSGFTSHIMENTKKRDQLCI